jgi:hypothetical protein
MLVVLTVAAMLLIVDVFIDVLVVVLDTFIIDDVALSSARTQSSHISVPQH